MRRFNEHGYSMKAWESPAEEIIPVCGQCLDPEAKEVCAGDEGLTVCGSCRGVEKGYKYLHESEVGT